MVDQEFSDLVPIFVEEARDRLEQLATLVPKVADDEEAAAAAKRELHTLKGAGRMLQVAAVAELCHAAEDLLLSEREGKATLLTRTVDRLVEMVEMVAEEKMPEPDEELKALLLGEEAEKGKGKASEKKTGKKKTGKKKAPKKKSSKKKTTKEKESPEEKADEEAPSKGKKKAKGTRKRKSGKKAKEDGGAGAQGEKTETPSKKGTRRKKKKKKATGKESEKASAAEGGAKPDEAAEASPEADAAPLSSWPEEGEETLRLRSEPADPAEGEGDGEEQPAIRPPSAFTGGEIRVNAEAIDKVADLATQMRIMALAGNRITERIYDLARLAEEGIHEDKPTQVLAVLATMLRRVAVDLEGGQRRLTRSAENQLEGVLTLQVQPVRAFLLSLARHARQLGRSLDKEVEVEIQGEETRLDRRIARELEDALLHLVRNAVDHGIESPEERRAAGKEPTGHLRLEAEASGSRVRLALEDDGGGIDAGKVIERAVEIGLLERGAARSMTKAEIYRLLFTPGFSTRSDISELSGRGVGLDVVASSAIRVGGEVFLSSELGTGTRVTLEVPLARRGEQILLLKIGQSRLAIPKGVVRRAEQITDEQVVERDGRTLAKIDDRLVPFVPLARVYGEASAEFQLLLEGELSGQPLAVLVDEVEGEEEVLVRPVPRASSTDQLLEGVALLASGEPIGILSPPMLARRDLLRRQRVVRERPASKAVRILLVDDSLVTREMERRLLEDAGFEVIAAGDADEALSSLGEESFDCVVTDIEMPGMDGFELTEHLRSVDHFSELPIIVVSTRDRPEDRLKGLKAGADAYLTKQSLDAGELVDLVRRLSGA